MKTTKLQNGRVVEFEKDFFLNTLVETIEKSEEIYSCVAHKVAVIGTLKMLFFKFQLAEYMDGMEVLEQDYKKFFKQKAIENNVDNFLYNKLFSGKEDEK